MAATTEDDTLFLTVRFATSIPDLPLAVPSFETTTTLSLKQLVRAHLNGSDAQSRIRLIHAGRVLPDTAPLSSVIKRPARPLRPPPSDIEVTRAAATDATAADSNDDSTAPSSLLQASSKRKGKQPVRDSPSPRPSPLGHQQPRIYVHCSIGDVLTPDELAEEAEMAAALEEALRSQRNGSVLEAGGGGLGADGSSSSAAAGASAAMGGAGGGGGMAPPPQGFDRLLGAGFTASEIAALRSQFLANISFTHTPDTMPSGNALRVLEDRWLDSTAHDGDGRGGAGDGEGTGGWGGGFGAEDGGLEDMLYGNLIGFFWPLGAICWGMREEGIWTKRKMLAIGAGVAINLLFGFARLSS